LTKFELSILIEKTVTNISDELLHEKGNRKHILLQLAYRGVAGEKLFHFLKKSHFQLNLMPELSAKELP